MEHFVTVLAFPKDLTIPSAYSSKIRYEADRGRLVYQGVMSKAEFDKLSNLSEDWSYRRPLEELFRLSIEETHSLKGWRRLKAVLSLFGH